jgi:5-methylcytosine-specific restriction endonuclease McrA
VDTPTIDYTDRIIYIKGKCICVYCGFDGSRSVLAWHQLLIDHVIPLRCKPSDRVRSGLNVEENKVVACWTCNNAKRPWDKKYYDANPDRPFPERVAEALESATQAIRRYYAIVDTDFEPMMKQIG